MKYEILDHPADLKIRAFGKDLPEVFLNCLLAMFDYLNGKGKTACLPAGRKSVKQELKVQNNNLEYLLIDFLNEALYLSQINKESYNNIKFKKFTNTALEAELIGQKIKKFKQEIKAVTYHDLEIKETNDHWQATVIFDI